VSGSRPRTTRSPSSPALIVPFSFPSKDAYAPFTVAMRMASCTEIRCLGPHILPMSVRVCETHRSATPERTSLRAESSVLFVDPEFPIAFRNFAANAGNSRTPSKGPSSFLVLSPCGPSPDRSFLEPDFGGLWSWDGISRAATAF